MFWFNDGIVILFSVLAIILSGYLLCRAAVSETFLFRKGTVYLVFAVLMLSFLSCFWFSIIPIMVFQALMYLVGFVYFLAIATEKADINCEKKENGTIKNYFNWFFILNYFYLFMGIASLIAVFNY